MRRYFFNFRNGDECSRDHVGMYLPDLDTARAEAIHAWCELLAFAEIENESIQDCEIEIVDAEGDTVLRIPFGDQACLH